MARAEDDMNKGEPSATSKASNDVNGTPWGNRNPAQAKAKAKADEKTYYSKERFRLRRGRGYGQEHRTTPLQPQMTQKRKATYHPFQYGILSGPFHRDKETLLTPFRALGRNHVPINVDSSAYTFKQDSMLAQALSTDDHADAFPDNVFDTDKINEQYAKIVENLNLAVTQSFDNDGLSATAEARLHGFKKAAQDNINDLKTLHKSQIKALSDSDVDNLQDRITELQNLHDNQLNAMKNAVAEQKSNLNQVMANRGRDITLAAQSFLINNMDLGALQTYLDQPDESASENLTVSADEMKKVKFDKLINSTEIKMTGKGCSGLTLDITKQPNGTYSINQKGEQGQWAKWNKNPPKYDKQIDAAAEEFAASIIACKMKNPEISHENQAFLEKVSSKLIDAGYDPSRITVKNTATQRTENVAGTRYGQQAKQLSDARHAGGAQTEFEKDPSWKHRATKGIVKSNREYKNQFMEKYNQAKSEIKPEAQTSPAGPSS